MSIEHIQTLSMNPHFYGLILQGFLSGYNKPCEVRLVFMALPILLYSESREKLANANSKSRIETLFNKPDNLGNNIKVSGKVKLSGYLKRFEEIKPFSKKALIILYSEKKVVFKQNKVFLIEPLKYLDFDKTVREWMRSAHYLGVIFARSNEDHLNYFLGVDRQ